MESADRPTFAVVQRAVDRCARVKSRMAWDSGSNETGVFFQSLVSGYAVC
jgi:hypothetical protein